MRHHLRLTITGLFLAATLLTSGAVPCAAASVGRGNNVGSEVNLSSAYTSWALPVWLSAVESVVRLQILPASATARQGGGEILNGAKHFRDTARRLPVREGRFVADQGGGINPNGNH